MTEKKRKRYPADRQKLHALLKKREQELIELQEEVEELRRLVQQADRTAIHATAELYHVTPEQLAEIMQSMFGDGLPSGLSRTENAVPSAEEELTPQKEEASADNDDA